MRMSCRLFLLVAMVALAASFATAQVNPRNPGSRRSDEPQIIELRCRGGGNLHIDVTRGEYHEADLYMNMTVNFERGSEGAGLTGGTLAPGQCALPDRALSPAEPTVIHAEVINFGQRNRQMHGDTVYRGDQAAEKYPDAQNIPPYLASPNHYWSFFGSNTSDGYFRITDLRYWRPHPAISSPKKNIKPRFEMSYAPIAMQPH